MRLQDPAPLLFMSLLFLAAPAAGAQQPPLPDPDVEVVVTATRLDDQGVRREDVPASITILTRELIEASGARTLQELLALEAGVVVYDQVGNDVQKTFDLRGFATGAGCAVYLNGARLNDPRNNGVALEAVPLDVVDRIEILRGSAAAVAGGGSEAGVVRIATRRAEAASGSLSVAAGSDAARRYGGDVGGRRGRFDGFASVSSDATDGFRANAGGDQVRLAATGGIDLGAARRLSLALTSSSLEYGNPGALTADEVAEDPRQADYNELDFSDSRERSAILGYRGSLSGAWSTAANVSWRRSAADTLTTGRAAAAGFGGFFLDADGSTLGSAAQATHDLDFATGGGSHLAVGVEWLDGSTDSLGFFTDPGEPGSFDRGSPSSDNTASRRNLALFVHETWRPTPRWSLSAGARRDDDRIDYVERVPDPTLRARRSFSEVSLRAGAVHHPTPRADIYVSYGESFLPPTVEQLFAFPAFGSNRDLLPESAVTVEAGLRLRAHPAALELALFRVATHDEIVFDPDSPLGAFGANVNAGKTLRTGVEIALEGRAGERLRWRGRYTRTDAEFRSGSSAGRSVPLVPKDRLAAALDLRLPAGLALRADALYVGEQVLDNDDANAQPALDAYAVANVRASWSVGAKGRALGREGRPDAGVTLFVEVRNLFDERYATRGIYAYDFIEDRNAVFLTPAPGRRVLGGATWRF